MGQRGPAPKPTALRILEGNRSKRPLNTREPQVDIEAPRCPAHLDRRAQKEWYRLAPALVSVKLLTEVDYMALGNLCQAYSTMAQAQRLLNKQGLLLKTQRRQDFWDKAKAKGKKKGQKKKPGRPKNSTVTIFQNPLLTVVNRQMEIIAKYCREFGLTPSSRSRIQVDQPQKEVDSLEAALG